MKHTKEEWTIEGNEIMTNNWQMIVKLPDDWASLNEEDKANARLIVNAPKLLALLKDILGWDEILPHSRTRIKQAITRAKWGTK